MNLGTAKNYLPDLIEMGPWLFLGFPVHAIIQLPLKHQIAAICCSDILEDVISFRVSSTVHIDPCKCCKSLHT